MSKAMIFDIQRNSFVDGPGIRTTVFFKGCNLRCAWCHNPEGQSLLPQLLHYRDKCTDCGMCRQLCRREVCVLCGDCQWYCPQEARKVCGREYTVSQVLAQAEKDKTFYDNSGGGVTFSGGECMLQIDFLAEILRACKEKDIHTAVDTAGYVPFESFARILPDTDLFLYDIKLFDRDKHKKHVGVENDRILDNLRRLFAAGAKLWIRIPVIGGINDNVEEMEHIKAFLDSCGKPDRVELLPYHAMGQRKAEAMGATAQVFQTPDGETMHRLRRVFAG